MLIPGAGHYVQLEQPDSTTAALRDFLTRPLGDGTIPASGDGTRPLRDAITQSSRDITTAPDSIT